MFCKNCGSEIGANDALCTKCGAAAGSGNKYCAECGLEVKQGSAFCGNCGTAVPKGDAGTGKRFCFNCGAQVAPDTIFCPHCGTNLSSSANSGAAEFSAEPAAEKSQKSKLAAGLLGIFLGGLGVHNFYLGNTKRALIQLLVSLLTCGIGGVAMSIWGLIEGVLILCGSSGYTTDSEGKTLCD